MTSNIKITAFLTPLLILTQACLALLQLPYYYQIANALAALTSASILIISFLKFTRRSVDNLNSLLAEHEKTNLLQFKNLELLEKKQEGIIGRYRSAATLISRLSDKEHASDTKIDTSDPIGKALVGIKSQMQKVREEDEKRLWINHGLAEFSKVLRQKSEIREYCSTIISTLIKYIHANQGGLYIAYESEEGERYLELMGCYAYGKRKFKDARIPEGEGLLGQCMLEKDFVFMTDVPGNYVTITSGLGEATPRNLIVAPLLFNDNLYGAIELASFKVMEPHQVEFLRKVCENVASEIATVRTMEKTHALLEESHKLTDELQVREEQMQQNLEELAATQEEMARKQAELASVLNAIDATLATAEFSKEGILVKCNAVLAEFFRSSDTWLNGKTMRTITGGAVTFEEIWYGDTRSGDFRTMTATGEDLWLSVTFTHLVDQNKQPVRVLCMIQDITDKKQQEQEFETLSLVTNNTDNSVVIADSDGRIEYVNAGFIRMTGYTLDEVRGRKPGHFLQGEQTDKTTIEKLRAGLRTGVPLYEEILNYHKKGHTYWVSLAINPVRDKQGKITKFISIQADITSTKEHELDYRQKMDALSRANAMLEVNKAGEIVEVNENYLNLLGYKREELVGKKYSLLTENGISQNVFQRIRDNGMQSEVAIRVDKQGNRHDLRLTDYPVLNLHGELEKVIEFAVDVTNERRHARAAELKQAELNSYLNGINNTIASAEFTIDGGFVTANEIFTRIMGYKPEELAGVRYDFFMTEDPTIHLMWENLRLGKFFSGEFKMKNHNGNEVWLTGTFNPITIEGNVPSKIMMFAQFNTQEKEKLNDLHTLVSAFKATLPVIEFNCDFSCKSANEKALKAFGLSRLALKSKTINDFIAPFYHSVWNRNNKNILDQDNTTLVLPIVSGETIMNFEVSFTVSRTLDGKISKIIVILVKEVPDHISLLAAV